MKKEKIDEIKLLILDTLYQPYIKMVYILKSEKKGHIFKFHVDDEIIEKKIFADFMDKLKKLDVKIKKEETIIKEMTGFTIW